MNKKELIIKLGENINQLCRANMYHRTNIPVTTAEMGMLIYIYTNSTIADVLSSQIAEYFDVSKASVTLLINSLVKEGFVKKKRDNKDKRKEPISLTEKGVLLIEEHMETYHKKTMEIVDMLGIEDAKKFSDILETATQIIRRID